MAEIASASAIFAKPSLNCLAVIKSCAAFNSLATSGRKASAGAFVESAAGVCAIATGALVSAENVAIMHPASKVEVTRDFKDMVDFIFGLNWVD